MPQGKVHFDHDVEYDDICSAAALGTATPDELTRLGPHLQVCAECRSQLYKYTQMETLFIFDGFNNQVAGSVREDDRICLGQDQVWPTESHSVNTSNARGPLHLA